MTSPEVHGPAPRLVVGDDGSAAADVVWLWVNNHDWQGWRVSVVTAQMPPVGPPVPAERATLHPWDPPHPRRLLGQDQVPVEHLVAEADPRVMLDSCRDAALIAVGPRGSGMRRAIHLGSTTDWLVGARRPLAPVVIVRAARQTRHVLLCVDGSAHSRAALEALLALPWLTSCRVTVLGVDDPWHTTRPAVEEAVAALRERGVTEVDEQVVEGAERVVAASVGPRVVGAREAILAELGRLSPDLVAVGARGTGGIRGLLVGSVTAAVVRHAECSVLVAKTVTDEAD